MAVFATLALPATLSSTIIDATFTADAGAGVSFTQLRHKEGGNFDWVTFLDDTGSRADLDGRLWQMTCTLRNGTSVTVSPTAAGQFVSYNVSTIYGGTAHLYEWRRVAITGAEDNDRVTVRLICYMATGTDRVFKIVPQVTRERGESATIESFMCPVMWVKSPAEIRAAENNLTAAKRTRVLIPQVVPNANGQVGSNTNMWLAASTGLFKTVPGINIQHLQVGAIYSANDLGASHRRTFLWHTMDTSGWHKAYYYEGLTYSTTNAFLKIGAIYYPRFGKVFARGAIENGLIPESTYGNSLDGQYPFAVGAMTAATNDWWYDVCDYYRTWYQAAAAPPVLATDTNRGNWAKTGAIWYGAVQVANKTALPQSTYYTTCVDVMRAWQSVLNSAEHSAYDYAVYHQQSTGSDFLLTMPGPDGVSRMSTYLRANADLAKSYGIRFSIYSMFEEWQFAFGQPWGLSQDLVANRAGTNTQYWQYVNPAFRQKLLNEGYTPLLNTYGGASFYCDLSNGQGAIPTYTPAGGDVGTYSIVPRHGNKERSVAKAAFYDQIRQKMIGSSQFLAGDTHGIIASESVEEFTNGKLDLTQDGYNFLPGHLCYAEQVIYNPATYAGSPDLTLTDYPAASRNLTPPLWQAVHHQWAPTGRFGVMPLNAGLATNTIYHPSGAFAGMSAAELIEAHCMSAGLIVAAGQSHLLDFDGGNNFPLLSYSGSQVVHNATYDPSNTAATIFAFYKTLYQAKAATFAGTFLNHGKMLRPPQVDPASADISKSTNPINACRKLAPSAFRGWPYFYDAGTWYTATSAASWDIIPSMTSGSQTFQVPHVAANIWQNSGGTIGLVLVNWSSSSATWKATINPTHYGAVNFRVDEISLAGVPTTLGSPAGTFTIGNVSAPTVSLGTIAARSVRVILLVPV